MKKLTRSTSVFTLLASTALAGGIDRSGQWITPIFDKGDVVTFSVATVDPNVSGTLGTNDATTRYSPLSFSIKKAITENVDVAIIADQPFGANIEYTSGPFAARPISPFAGGYADVSSKALTFVGRYKFDNNMSILAGARAQSLSGKIASIFDQGTPDLSDDTRNILNASGDYAWSGLVGVAYERPDIAMRVALTYNTSIDNKLTGIHTIQDASGAHVSDTPVDVTHESPESINLEFQTGIATDTLLFGSVRHAKWRGRSLDSTPIGGGSSDSWVNFRDNSTSYTLGVGRKINDKLSLAVTLGYEAAGTRPGNTALAPTTGYKSIGLGASYNVTEQMKITGGVQYIKPGNQSVVPVDFSGDAVAFGMKISYSF